MTMRLLVVGMANSPHLHRWVGAVAGPGMTIAILPSLQAPLLPGQEAIPLARLDEDLPPGIHIVAPQDIRSSGVGPDGYQPLTHPFVPVSALACPDRVAEAMARFRPHLLHSMESQIAGYVVAEAVRRGGRTMPWIHSTWGSDLALYGRLPDHRIRLSAMFRAVDIHLADCRRDLALARELGYRGPDMPVLPSSCGVDVDALAARATVPPSRRRRILVKGYQNWSGRNLLALSALMLIAEALEGYEIVIPNADPALREWAGLMANRTALRVTPLPRLAEEAAVMEEMAAARVLVSLSLSDGLPTMVLEAMALGAFPVQSRAGCAAEWFEHGVGGFSVPANDTRAVAEAIRTAVTDDVLVDAAARRNLAVVRRDWDAGANGERARAIYREALAVVP